MKLNAKIIFLLFGRKEGKKMFTAVIDGKLFMINQATFEACVNGTINEVTFVADSSVTLADGKTVLPTFKVADCSFSQFRLIDQAIKIKSNSLTTEDLKLAASLQQGNL